MPATIDDLTSYVGETVSDALWKQVQMECSNRYGDLWTLHAKPVSDGWRIVRLEVKHHNEKYESWAARHGAV